MSAGLALKIHLKHHTFKRSAAQASHPDALFQRNGHEDANSVIAAAGKQIYIREWQLTATRDEMVTRHEKWRARPAACCAANAVSYTHLTLPTILLV